MAAEQGYSRAQHDLAIIYHKGAVGVTKNVVLMYMWAGLAAARGDDVAAEIRDVAEASMTPEQLVTAQQLAGSLALKVQKEMRNR